MATYVIQKRYRDPNTGDFKVKALFAFTGVDSSAADTVAGRLGRAARNLWLYKQYPPAQRSSDHTAWVEAATATLGALDPEAVSDEENIQFDAYYTVSEVPAFTEPSEDPPANEQERTLRDQRDADPEP